METNPKIEGLREKIEVKKLHYHGDKVRNLYLIIGVILLLATPFFKYRLSGISLYSILGILVLVLIAGLTSPKSQKIILLDTIVSLAMFAIFGYQAIISYTGEMVDAFFLCNLLLALLSLFAVYFSSKTLRGNLQS